MPANLNPEYFAAEKRYRQAGTTAEKIECLEEMLMVMPKHKGTDKLRADLRRRISKLKDAVVQAKKSVRRQDTAFQIDKEGAGQVMVVGPPNSGKSSLIKALTNAEPEISEAPLTTWKPLPGMMPIKDIQIQLVDTPPVNPNFSEPAMVELIKRTDLILIVTDLHADPNGQLEETVNWLEERRMVPSNVNKPIPDDRLLYHMPFVVAVNKNDDTSSDENLEIVKSLLDLNWPLLGISVKTGRNLDSLKKILLEGLEIIRVYSKIPGKNADMTAPFILKQGSSVQEFARQVHNDFAISLKIAKVWGEAVYDGQMVQHNHILSDGDVVELHI
jgi:ribosome-interacting GTPase 1